MAGPVVIADHAGLLAAVRARVAELGLTHEVLDYVAGWQSGYAGKLLANPPIKRLGPMSYWLMLEALGYRLTLQLDEQLCAQLAPFWQRRVRPRRNLALAKIGLVRTVTPAMLRAWGAAGGRARAQTLSERRRRQIAKLAVQARERKRRAADVEQSAAA